jgi:hypothetical protein
MKLIYAACLILFGAYCGICVVENVAYSNGFEAGYGDGIHSADRIIEGVYPE